MEKEEETTSQAVLPVLRTKEEARHLYDLISKLYDYFTVFERRYSEEALKRLLISEGETVLEIGFGTGRLFKQIAETIGNTGKTYCVDISPGMSEVTLRRLTKAGSLGRVELYCGDALNLPYENGFFNAVFMSFALELFDTPEIPKLLEEVKRVLKIGGRLGVVGISKENGNSMFLRVYEWLHRKMPKYFDCRPIYVERSLRDSGYQIASELEPRCLGYPLKSLSL